LAILRFAGLSWILPIRAIASGLYVRACRNGVGAAEPAVKIDICATLRAKRTGRKIGRLSANRTTTNWLFGFVFAGSAAILGGGHNLRETFARATG
jgi:hypothetical protein